MSNWELICRNKWWSWFEKCYPSPYFPLGARGLLAAWLEREGLEAMWDVDENNDQQGIDSFLADMVHELGLRCALLPINYQDHANKERMKETIRQIQWKRSRESVSLFKIIKQSLQNENLEIARLLNPSTRPHASLSNENSPTYGLGTPEKLFSDLDKEVKTILHKTELSVNDMLNKASAQSNHYEGLRTLHSQLSSRQSELGTPNETNFEEIQNINQALRSIQAHFLEAPGKLQGLLNEIKIIIPPLQRAQVTSLNQIKEFQEEQGLGTIGGEPEMNPKIEMIDEWFGKISGCIAIMQQTLQTLYPDSQRYATNTCGGEVQELSNQLTTLHNQMIGCSLVIESQPGPIITKNIRLGKFVLRILTCSENMMVDKKMITIMLTNDATGNPQYTPATFVGTLKGGRGCPNVKKNVITFKDLKVKDPERTTRRGERNVVEEQFYINFTITVNIDGVSHCLWTRSLPLIIMTHPNQTGDAMATVIWYNALEPHERKPFSQHRLSPPNVSWNNLIKVIDLLFKKVGKGLSEGNKAYLKTKLFRVIPQPNDMVSYELFCETNRNARDDPTKDKFLVVDCRLLNKFAESDTINSLNGQALENDSKIFSFWGWVWSFLELINPRRSNNPEDPKQLVGYSLKRLWKEGKIAGFLSKEEILERLEASLKRFQDSAMANAMPLPQSQNPDEPNFVNPFLLRFPDGRPEAIGMYFLRGDNNQLTTTKAYITKDLDKMSLEARILGCKLVTHLEPDIKKDIAFTMTIQETEIINGYLMSKLIVQEYLPSRLLSQFNSIDGNKTSSPSTSQSVGTTNPPSAIPSSRGIEFLDTNLLGSNIGFAPDDWTDNCVDSADESDGISLNRLSNPQPESSQMKSFDGIDVNVLTDFEMGK